MVEFIFWTLFEGSRRCYWTSTDPYVTSTCGAHRKCRITEAVTNTTNQNHSCGQSYYYYNCHPRNISPQGDTSDNRAKCAYHHVQKLGHRCRNQAERKYCSPNHNRRDLTKKLLSSGPVGIFSTCLPNHLSTGQHSCPTYPKLTQFKCPQSTCLHYNCHHHFLKTPVHPNVEIFHWYFNVTLTAIRACFSWMAFKFLGFCALLENAIIIGMIYEKQNANVLACSVFSLFGYKDSQQLWHSYVDVMNNGDNNICAINWAFHLILPNSMHNISQINPLVMQNKFSLKINLWQMQSVLLKEISWAETQITWLNFF